jgi:hypothetical protein
MDKNLSDNLLMNNDRVDKNLSYVLRLYRL